MTADLVQNGTEAEAGDNPPFPSLERANYDQDMPSINLTLQKNKGDVVSVKINILVGVNDEERVDCQNETENRQSAPALLIKGATDYEEGADGHLRGQGGFHEHPTLPGEEIRNLRLRDLCEMDEAGGDDGVEDSDGAEVNPWVGLKKPQAVTAAAHQAQPNHITQQVMTGGWENFLPQRNLRILLVEDDNSTRHVVGALLRNCGYEVTSAASVVQAWELLQDKSSHFDLALTDVMLPSFSGISLLAKIMNQQSCKQIPVVIMSSLDSVDIVFKCLSKGAVDFLVKPVRKNELKNLWQHVWRKCHRSSGSGSGSGSQTGKVEGLKNMNTVGNDSCSNDNESSNMNAAGGSDNGSGTQSFWTKRGVEVESSHRPTEWDVARCFQRAKAHAVAQKKLGILPKDKRSSLDAIRGLTSSQAKAPDQVMEKGLEITASRTGASDSQMADNAHLKDANLTVQNVLPLQGVEQNAHLDDEGMPDQGEAALKSETVAIDLLGNIACQAKKKEKQHCSGHGEIDREVCNSPTTKDNVSGSVSLPALELTLKRPHTVEEEDSKVEDRLVLRQSGASAFSRYSNSGAVLQQQLHVPVGAFTMASFSVQGGYVGHTAAAVTAIGANQISELRIATPADRAGPFQGSAEASTPLPLHSQLSCAANNQEMTQSVVGSSGQKIIVQAVKGEGGSASGMPISIAVPARAMLSFDGVGAFASSRHPVFFTHSSKSPWAATNFPDREGQQFEDHGLPLQTHQETYHHSSHHYHHHHVQHHHHHHHAHTNSLSPESPEDEPTVTNPGTGAPQCGSSNMIGTVPGNLGQSGSSNGYYVNGNGNGSASGSNNGSNTHNGNSNGQSGIMATAGAYGDSGNNNGISGSGNGHGISSVNGSGVVVGPEQNCFTRREAALNKFRQKRKERCFEKKVRYQSRKKLAEQRPRVRGQFVRQAITILPTADRRHGNNEFVLAVTDCVCADAERG